MSVLARELDAYQRALQQYLRQAQRHNRQVNAYRDTVVMDAEGRPLILNPRGEVVVVDGQELAFANLPDGTALTDYGLTPVEGAESYRMLRQGNPIEARRETVEGARKIPGFNDDYHAQYRRGDEILQDGAISDGSEFLGPEWRMEGMTPGQPGIGEAMQSPDSYRLSRDASVYMAPPEEWTREFNMKAPSATFAQVKKLNTPTLADIEAGLIGQVMRGKGVR